MHIARFDCHVLDMGKFVLCDYSAYVILFFYLIILQSQYGDFIKIIFHLVLSSDAQVVLAKTSPLFNIVSSPLLMFNSSSLLSQNLLRCGQTTLVSVSRPWSAVCHILNGCLDFSPSIRISYPIFVLIFFFLGGGGGGGGRGGGGGGGLE